MTVEVLTRSKGLMQNISPTGVQYKVVQCLYNNALYQIKSDKVGPELKELSGLYTSSWRAQRDLTKYLNEFWAMSDTKKSK
jgi:hypothetical protein